MATLAEELTALKTAEDRITGNKVANFAYDDYAYTNDDANGVDTYDVNAHQNIPNGTASILKVNPTILTKGWRAQASSITRMIMNHFLGRTSYNLNKVNDYFSSLLAKLIAYLEQPNGIATLNSEGKVTALNNVVNTGDSATPVSGGMTKFTTGGAYTELAKKAPNNHASSSNTYGEATTALFGHVKKHTRTITAGSVVATSAINLVYNAIHLAWNSSTSDRNVSLTNSDDNGKFAMVLTVPDNGGNVTSAFYTVNNGTPVSISVPAHGMCIILSLDFYTCHLVN